KPDDVGTRAGEVIEKRPKGRGTAADGVLVPRGWAVSAARQIGDDHAKSLFKRRDLKRPGRSAASESVDEHQWFALTAFQIVQRKIFVAKKRHGRMLLVLFLIADSILSLLFTAFEPCVAPFPVIVSPVVL